MQRTPPRHLAPPARNRARARDHLLVESILAVVAIGLTTAILIGTLLDRPESSAARLPNLLPPAPTTTRAAATTPVPASSRPAQDAGNLLADPGFEAGLAGWRPVGMAGVERVQEGRDGGWALRLTRGSAQWPGILHRQVTRMEARRRYEATAWVLAGRPGLEVQVNLFELAGGRRYAVDSVGAVAHAGEWQLLEVSHDAHRPGAVLALEILVPNLNGPTDVLVDDLAVRARASSMSTH
jgi:hypothetical protein